MNNKLKTNMNPVRSIQSNEKPNLTDRGQDEAVNDFSS